MMHSQKLEALLEFIREKSGARHVELLDFRLLSGGAIQENRGLSVCFTGGSMPGEHHFVVRSDAPASLSVSLTRPQEFDVLKAACATGIHVPRVFWLCTDHSVLGADFYVMQWVVGSANARNLVKDDGLAAGQRKALLFQLGRDMALLHNIDHSPSILPFLAQPQGSAASQRVEQYRRSLSRVGQPHPVIELGLSYLMAYAPADLKRVLCHCDFRTGNYLVENGRLTAILDWEFAAWSDPYEDLGWMCARSWRFGANQREAGGVGDKADLFAGYESVSGQPVDAQRVAYWELMASVRWAVIALEQSQRHLSGQQESLELALTGRILPEIEQDIMSHLRLFLATREGQNEIPDQGENVELQQSSNGDPACDNGGAFGPDRVGHAITEMESRKDPFGDLPDGASLLHTGRLALLNDVLPALEADQHYAAHMVARAMAIAMRELTEGEQVRLDQECLVRNFYRSNASAASAASMSDLAQDIRNERFGGPQRAQLFTLMDELLALKLRLSNPKRLGH